MKNFTNNFKQFTSRLSARWLIMALMLLLGTSSAWGWTIYYDNSGTPSWTDVYVVIGHDTWWRSYQMTKNNNVFQYTDTGWDDATFIAFSNSHKNSNGGKNTDWNSISNIRFGYGVSHVDKHVFTTNSSKLVDITHVNDVLNGNVIGFYVGEYTSWNQQQFYVKNSSITIPTCLSFESESSRYGVVYASSFDYTISHGDGTWDGPTLGEKAVLGTAYLVTSNNSVSKNAGTLPSCTFSIDNTIKAGETSTKSVTSSGKSKYGTQDYAEDSYYVKKSGETSLTKLEVVGNELQTQSLAVGEYTIYVLLFDGRIYAKGGEQTLTVETACEKPSAPSITINGVTGPVSVSICSGDDATLTAGNTTNGLTYTLYNGETPGESQTSTGGNLTFEVGEAGNYTVRVSNSCGTSTSTVVTITVCTPTTNEFRHANSNYTQQQAQPTYYPGDKAYFVSTNNCCLTGTWSANLQKGEEAWYTGLTGGTPRFYMTLTRAGEFTITNMATNNCTQDKNVLVNLDFTVTALSQVTNANGTASGADIALTWKHSTNHTKVMVVRYPTASTETIPAGGQSYSAGNTLGEGTVVYVGTSESYIDKNLPYGESYKYYFYTVNNNYYSDGVVLNMSSCPTPAKPQLESTAVTTCNGNVTTFGSITIANMENYKDDKYNFKLGERTANPDADGKIVIISAANTEYTVTVTNSCGNQNSANVEIAINNITPTISGATYTQPGKDNAIELSLPEGVTAKWTVSGGDIDKSEGNKILFSAEEDGVYTIFATNGACSDTHEVTVSDELYIWVRNAKEGETAYENFYFPDQNTEDVRGGEMFYAECEKMPTNGNTSQPEYYVNYNKGGREADLVNTDCEGYTWYGFKASDEVIAGTKYFYVHATNDINNKGFFTHTVPTKKALTADVYYKLCETSAEECGQAEDGWKIVEASAPYAGPMVHASGDAKFNANNFADFVSLYVTDCSGNEVTGYQWSYTAPTCTYIGKETVTMSASTSNNIRVREAGNYTCTVKYKDGSTATSAALAVSADDTDTPSLAEFTSNLPIIMVNTNGEGFPDCTGLSGQTASKNASTLKAKRSVDVIIKDGNNIIYDRKARMNYRGSSSLNFVKKSYAFCPGDANCEEKDGQADYVKTAKLNMLGVGKACDKDWVLYAAAADPSLMRNRLMFDTFRDMTGGWSVNSMYVELVINGEYKGVYVLMDKITANEKRVNVSWNLDKQGNTTQEGFIVKFDKTDIADRYENTSGDQKTFKSTYSGHDGFETYDTDIDQRFEIEYPEKEDIEEEDLEKGQQAGDWSVVFNSIKDKFNKFEKELKDGNFSEVQKIIDYQSWADWFIITEFGKNIDGYRASNLFVYDGSKPNAKIEARPLWDQELSFDNHCPNYYASYGANSGEGFIVENSEGFNNDASTPFWFTGKYKGGRGTYNGSNQTFKGLLDDPCFVAMVKTRWETHKSNALSESKLNAKLEAYTTEMGAAKDREAAFWSTRSRGTCQCSYSGSTGYDDVSFTDSKKAITDWIGKRPTGLTTAINALKGLDLTISLTVTPEGGITTPWEAVMVQVNNPFGYDYDLNYTTNTLDKVEGVIISENNDKYTYRIPRPSTWGTGDGERDAIEYGIQAILNVADDNLQCGTINEELTKADVTITLKDEEDDDCSIVEP